MSPDLAENRSRMAALAFPSNAPVMQLGNSVRRKPCSRDAGIAYFRFTELRNCEERLQKLGHANHSDRFFSTGQGRVARQTAAFHVSDAKWPVTVTLPAAPGEPRQTCPVP